jgi:hypothetical protein
MLSMQCEPSEEASGQRKRVRWLAAALVLLIATGWIMIASLYVRAAALLGRWPHLYRDDPKSLPLGFHYEITIYAVVAVVVGTAVALLLGSLGLFAKSTRPSAAWVLAVAAVSLGLYIGSPLVAWYLD